MPEAPNDTTIIIPGDTVITSTDTIITPADTIVTPVNEPLALFTVTNNHCTAGCLLHFANLSVYADTYQWDFGDGSAGSTATNSEHYYNFSGTYRVILTASRSGQSNRDTQMVTIQRPVFPYAIGTSSRFEYAFGLVQTNDGGYVVTGIIENEDGSKDMYLFKTDASRNVIWEKHIGGSGNQAGHAIKPTSDGGYVIVGSTSNSASGSGVYLVKTDAEGSLLWERTLSNIVGQGVKDIIQTGDGGFLMTGISRAQGSSSDLLLIRTDENGNVIWEKNMGTSNEDTGYTLQQASDGHYLVGGTYNYGFNTGQPYMIKIDDAGDIIWEKPAADGLKIVKSLQETSDGGIIWAGQDGFSTSHWHGMITKTDADGNVEWSRKFYEPGILFNEIQCVRQTSDGGFVICGQMDASGYSSTGHRLIFVIKTDATGNVVWTKSDYALNSKTGNAYDIQQTPDGGYILAGYIVVEPSAYFISLNTPLSAYDFDAYLLKIDQNGTPQ